MQACRRATKIALFSAFEAERLHWVLRTLGNILKFLTVASSEARENKKKTQC